MLALHCCKASVLLSYKQKRSCFTIICPYLRERIQTSREVMMVTRRQRWVQLNELGVNLKKKEDCICLTLLFSCATSCLNNFTHNLSLPTWCKYVKTRLLQAMGFVRLRLVTITKSEALYAIDYLDLPGYLKSHKHAIPFTTPVRKQRSLQQFLARDERNK